MYVQYMPLVLFHADSVRKLFTEVRYSSKGTSCRVREETAFSYFIDYLDACEGGNTLKSS